MWTHFLLEVAHFAISFCTALVFLAAFWLYFDSKKHRRSVRDYVRCGGLLLLSGAFVVSSVMLETTVLSVPIFQLAYLSKTVLLFKTLGYSLVLVAAVTDKLQPKPKNHETLVFVPIWGVGLMVAHFLPAVLSLSIAIAYLIRSVIGLEAHIKRVSIAFFLFAFSEMLSLSALLRQTDNVTLLRLVEPFASIWILQHVVLAIAALVLARWVFGYLLKQFRPQLFIIFSVGILTIFLTTTTAFTTILLKNIQDETLRQLENDVRVLQYALKSKREEGVSDVVAIAQDPDVQAAMSQENREELAQIAEKVLLAQQYSSVMMIDSDGQVIARGEDTDTIGSFLAQDALVKRALAGNALSSIATTEGTLAPQILLRAAAPVILNEAVLGVVMVGINLDNAFVDGIKNETGLEASLYGQNVLSATTLLSSDRETRLTGLIEHDERITQPVLLDSEQYSGSITIGHVPYFAVISPLVDADNIPVGMLLIGKEQLGVLHTASRSMQLTFIVAAVLLILSVIPSYLITRYISNQLR